MKRYETPAAFREALEQRLRSSSASGVDYVRRRQLLVFDRFLARVFNTLGDAVTLKGGLALELRLERARTTKDVDLRVMGPPADLLRQLQAAARLSLSDFMEFHIAPDERNPEINNEGIRYEGRRFRASCRLAGKPYGQPFGVDVVFGDPLFFQPEVLQSDDYLGFAGIERTQVRVYPVATHIAEKLHAYTMPRSHPNSRIKDLPDLALIAGSMSFTAEPLQSAIRQTFDFRGTHSAPTQLPAPPAEWKEPYARIAKDDALPWSSILDVFNSAAAFLNPVLSGRTSIVWDPTRVQWSPSDGRD